MRNRARVIPFAVRPVLRLAVIVAAFAPAAAYGASTLYISPAHGIEPTLLSELNLVRADNGLKPLRLNARLSAAANQHSTEMVEAGYFGHASADGSVFWRRIRRFYSPGRSTHPWLVGENLLWQAPGVSGHAAVLEWLRSPEHRENLLRPAYRDVGIAAIRATAAPGVYGHRRVLVLTVDFGTR